MSNEKQKQQAVEQYRAPAVAVKSTNILLDDRMYERVKEVATMVSRAEGLVPKHLLGKAHACFGIVSRSLTWNLDPYAVACSTFTTPDGKIGYEGKLCQAILKNSGQIKGAIRYEHFGDWSKVQAKFKFATSQKGRQYPVPDWKPEDEEGLGVVVSANVVGETEPRELTFELKQAYPRNSTLWATDPKTQICYTAVRRFASVAAPELFMGVPFDDELARGPMIDVTPERPSRERFVAGSEEQAKVDEARMEAGFRGATGQTVYDEETGEIEEDGEAETETETETETESEPGGAEDAATSSREETEAPEQSAGQGEASQKSPTENSTSAPEPEAGDTAGPEFTVVPMGNNMQRYFGSLLALIKEQDDPVAFLEANRAGAERWAAKDKAAAGFWKRCFDKANAVVAERQAAE